MRLEKMAVYAMFAASMLSGCGADGQTVIPTVLDVAGGMVEGVEQPNSVLAFKGIPFAAPPVGDLRWAAPQPVVGWDGIRPVHDFGPACMQDERGVILAGGTSGVSEDCLYLNVWTPKRASGRKLPVMVYVYGGGFAGGTPGIPAFDGAKLANEGDVVVVTIAYRVGVFGFLAHPQLSQETGHGSGTWALQDSLAALKWVNGNIAGFGGDKDNVTLWGQSSGAYTAEMLAAAPPAKGLFKRIIAESGGGFAPSRTNDEPGLLVPTQSRAEAEGTAFLAGLGVATIAQARKLDAKTVLQAPHGLFWPVADGYMVRDNPSKAYSSGQMNDVAIMAGWNADDALFPSYGGVAEFKQSVAAYGTLADRLLAVYPHATDAEAAQSGRGIQRDVLFGWPTRALARAQTTFGRESVYVYYYNGARPTRPAGATHGAETMFLFDYKVSEEDVPTARAMRAYWLNFAKTGNPNGSGVPVWPVYSLKDEKVMSFEPAGVIPYPNVPAFEVWNDYFARP